MAIDERLGLLTYKNDHETHIKLRKEEVCSKDCKDKACTFLCPAEVYLWNPAASQLKVQYENCIECGGCRMICPWDNIDCDWPRGGYGVAYKYG
ncbi:MAG: 4Fe-4S dicluster domain-containing protein [Elusimicrobiota bacterium]